MLGKQLMLVGKTLEVGLSSTPVLWQMASVCFAGDVAWTRNGYVVVEMPFDSKGFKGYVKGWSFVDIVKSLPENVDYTLDVDENKVVLRSSKSEMEFRKIGEEEPRIVGTGDFLNITNSIFPALKSVVDFTGEKEIIPALRGVCVDKFIVIASDNIRIARVKLGDTIEASLLLPGSGVRSLISISEGRQLDNVRLLKDVNLVGFYFNDGVVVFVSLLSLDYPELGHVFDDVSGEEWEFLEGFVECVRRVGFSQEGFDRIMKLQVKDRVLRVIGESGNVRYEEEFVGSGLSDKEFSVVVKEFLEIVERSSRIVFGNTGVLFFKDREGVITFAMLPVIEEETSQGGQDGGSGVN